MPQNWNQTSQPIREIGIKRPLPIPNVESADHTWLLGRVSGAKMPIENEAEENPRITAIERPETSNLRPFVYRFQNAKVHEKDRCFYRLFIKKTNWIENLNGGLRPSQNIGSLSQAGNVEKPDGVKTLKTRCGQRLERFFHVGTWGNLDREAKRYTAPHRKTMIAGIVWPDLPIPPRRNGATSER